MPGPVPNPDNKALRPVKFIDFNLLIVHFTRDLASLDDEKAIAEVDVKFASPRRRC